MLFGLSFGRSRTRSHSLTRTRSRSPPPISVRTQPTPAPVRPQSTPPLQTSSNPPISGLNRSNPTDTRRSRTQSLTRRLLSLSLFDSASVDALTHPTNDPVPPYPPSTSSLPGEGQRGMPTWPVPTMEQARELWKRERPYFVEVVRREEAEADAAEEDRRDKEAKRIRREARRQRRERQAELDAVARRQEQLDKEEVDVLKAIRRDARRKVKETMIDLAAATGSGSHPHDYPNIGLHPPVHSSQLSHNHSTQNTAGFQRLATDQAGYSIASQVSVPLLPGADFVQDQDRPPRRPTELDLARTDLFGREGEVIPLEFLDHLNGDGRPTFGGVNPHVTTATTTVPDPTLANFSLPIDPELYNQQQASGSYHVPRKSFTTLGGKFASFTSGLWKEVDRELGAEEAEVALATGKVQVAISRGQKVGIKTLLSPVLSETEFTSTHRRHTSSPLSFTALSEPPTAHHDNHSLHEPEWSRRKRHGGIEAWQAWVTPPSDAGSVGSTASERVERVRLAEQEFAMAEEAMWVAEQRMMDQHARADRHTVTASAREADRDRKQAPQPGTSAPTSTIPTAQPSPSRPTHTIFSPPAHPANGGGISRSRAEISYPPPLSPAEKSARAQLRQLGATEGVEPLADPRSTARGQKAERWKLYQAYLARRQEIVDQIAALDEADRVLVEAVGAAPQEGRRVGRLYAEGGVLCGKQEWETVRGQAWDWLERALQYDPDQPVALREVGGLWLAAGNVATATEYLEQSINYNPDDPLTWLLYGRALIMRDGDEPSPEAHDALARAAEADTVEGVVACTLIAEVFASFDTPDKLARAIEVYEEAGQVREAVAATAGAGKLEEEAGGVRVLTVAEIGEAIRRIERQLSELVAGQKEGERPQLWRSRTAPPLGMAGEPGELDDAGPSEWREVPWQTYSVSPSAAFHTPPGSAQPPSSKTC